MLNAHADCVTSPSTAASTEQYRGASLLEHYPVEVSDAKVKPSPDLDERAVQIYDLCRAASAHGQRLRVVDIASQLTTPRAAVKLFLSDLCDAGLVRVEPDGRPEHADPAMLQRMISALEGSVAPPEAPVEAPSVKVFLVGGASAHQCSFITAAAHAPAVRSEELMITTDAQGSKILATVTVGYGARFLAGASALVHLVSIAGPFCEVIWDDLVREAAGAVILIDAHRPAACAQAVSYIQQRDLPAVAALHEGRGGGATTEVVRQVAGLDAAIPVVGWQSRDSDSAIGVLRAVLDQMLDRAGEPVNEGP